MKKILFCIAIIFSITSCSLFRVHKMDIEQGNVMTPEMISKLHKGMTEDQVEDVLGTPMLTNTFTPNQVDYVYTFKPGYGNLNGNLVTLTFRNGRLQSVSGNRYSAFMK